MLEVRRRRLSEEEATWEVAVYSEGQEVSTCRVEEATPTHGRLEQLYTPPRHRGQGFGRLAFVEAFKLAQERYSLVTVVASPFLEGLSAGKLSKLYQSVGFTLDRVVGADRSELSWRR